MSKKVKKRTLARDLIKAAVGISAALVVTTVIKANIQSDVSFIKKVGIAIGTFALADAAADMAMTNAQRSFDDIDDVKELFKIKYDEQPESETIIN